MKRRTFLQSVTAALCTPFCGKAATPTVTNMPSEARWSGAVSDVKFYNRALTTEEIKQVYLNTKHPLNKGLVKWWTPKATIYDTGRKA